MAAGPIADLRASDARRLLRVEVEDAAPGWIERLAGVRVLQPLPDGAILEIVDHARESDVLDAARAAGDVRHFSVVQPSLTDIFRKAVQE